jgi:hypothetical protein
MGIAPNLPQKDDLRIYAIYGGANSAYNTLNNPSSLICIPAAGVLIGVAWRPIQDCDASSGVNRFTLSLNGSIDSTIYFDVPVGTVAAIGGRYDWANPTWVNAGDMVRIISDGDQQTASASHHSFLIRR